MDIAVRFGSSDYSVLYFNGFLTDEVLPVRSPALLPDALRLQQVTFDDNKAERYQKKVIQINSLIFVI